MLGRPFPPALSGQPGQPSLLAVGLLRVRGAGGYLGASFPANFSLEWPGKTLAPGLTTVYA